jgi:hypothetical protein
MKRNRRIDSQDTDTSGSSQLLRLALGTIVASGIMVLFLGACEPEAEPERGYLEGVPCSAPCWQGITPGVTTEEEALAIIHDSGVVVQDSIHRVEVTSLPFTHYYLFHTIGGSRVAVYIAENVVHHIGIEPNLELPLSQVVDTYGPPDWIMIDNWYTDRICYSVAAYWVQLGIDAGARPCLDIDRAYGRSGAEYEVAPSLDITGIGFFPPQSDIKATWDYLGRTGYTAVPTTPWHGFGFYPESARLR